MSIAIELGEREPETRAVKVGSSEAAADSVGALSPLVVFEIGMYDEEGMAVSVCSPDVMALLCSDELNVFFRVEDFRCLSIRGACETDTMSVIRTFVGVSTEPETEPGPAKAGNSDATANPVGVPLPEDVLDPCLSDEAGIAVSVGSSELLICAVVSCAPTVFLARK